MLDKIAKHLNRIDTLESIIDRRKTEISNLIHPIVVAWARSEMCSETLCVDPRGMSKISIQLNCGNPDLVQCSWHHTFRGEQDGSYAQIPKRYFIEGGADQILAESEKLRDERAARVAKKIEATERAQLAALQQKYGA